MVDERKLRKSPGGLIEEHFPSDDGNENVSAQETTYATLVEAVLVSLETRAKEVLVEHGLSIENLEVTTEEVPGSDRVKTTWMGYKARAEQRYILDRAYFALMIMDHVQQVRSFLSYGATAAAWAMWELSQDAFKANLLVEEKSLNAGRSVIKGGRNAAIHVHGTETERMSRWQQYREDFEDALKSGARSKTDAYEQVAKKHEVSSRTIARALKRL